MKQKNNNVLRNEFLRRRNNIRLGPQDLDWADILAICSILAVVLLGNGVVA